MIAIFEGGTFNSAKVDAAAVKTSLPRGQITVKVVNGGLNVPAEGSHDLAVIASTAIAVRFEVKTAQ